MTWLNSNISGGEITLPSFKTIYLDCSGHGGGVIIFVANEFKYSLVLSSKIRIFSFFLIFLNNSKYFISVLCWPPNAPINFLEDLEVDILETGFIIF